MTPPVLNRSEHLAAAQDPARTWDVLVIGGGATGAGIAVDAAACATCSRATSRW